MAIALLPRQQIREETVKWIWDRPITFDEFLDQLARGLLRTHRRRGGGETRWSSWITRSYCSGSGPCSIFTRTPAGSASCSARGPQWRSTSTRRRLPDLFFVSQERIDIVRQKATYGAPDLVIEILSPNDRPSDIIALETDYRAIGVREIIFIDATKRRIRVLRRHDADFAEEMLTEGDLRLETLAGTRLETAWLFDEPRPDERETADVLGDG